MKKLFSKYKTIIITVCVAAVVLIVAFFAGGNISSTDSGSKHIETPSSSVINDRTEPLASTANKGSQNNTNASQSTSSSVLATQPASTIKSTSQPRTESVTRSSSKTQESAKNTKPTDRYHTEKVPDNKPKPVEPQNQETKDTTLYCSFYISCGSILNNSENIDSEILALVPANGIIYNNCKVKFSEGESVYDILQRICKENKIHLESKWTPIFNSAYIEGINNIYEIDCGEDSGWKYSVNDWFPNYGCSRYQLKNGDSVKFLYTCDGGADIGSDIF